MKKIIFFAFFTLLVFFSFITPIQTHAAPAKPTNLKATPACRNTASIATFSWSAVTGATYYKLNYVAADTNPGAAVNTINVVVTTYTYPNSSCTSGPLSVSGCGYNYDKGIAWGVTACNSTGCSAESFGATFTSSYCGFYACNSTTHACYKSSSGKYSSLSTCNTACAPTPTPTRVPTSTPTPTSAPTPTPTSRPTATPTPTPLPPATKYNCNTSTYTCSVSATGSYTDKAACETSCNPPATKYNCNTSTYTCSVSATGSYTDKAACETSCNPPPPPPPSPPLPSCPSSLFSAFAPAGVPTGGICMLNKIIGIFLNVLIVTAIILAILFLIWGGIDWITSGGDKQKLQSARHKLTFAIIGLVVVFVSFLILNFIFNFFGIYGGGGAGAPRKP